MDRAKLAQEFDIPQHALLFAYIYRNACTVCPEKGAAACDEGTKLYGLERGGRMAQRALAQGKELSMGSYMLFGEWEDKNGRSASETSAYAPVYKSCITRCGWCTAWEEAGLLDYGKNYCNFVDKHLVKGFNENNNLNINSTLSHGDSCCDFEWLGFALNSEEEKLAYAKERQTIGNVTKDFLYHCGHLLSAMTKALKEHLTLEQADKIISLSLEDFTKKFGEEMCAAVVKEAEKDFTKVED